MMVLASTYLPYLPHLLQRVRAFIYPPRRDYNHLNTIRLKTSGKPAVVQAFRPAVSGRPKGLHYIRRDFSQVL